MIALKTMSKVYFIHSFLSLKTVPKQYFEFILILSKKKITEISTYTPDLRLSYHTNLVNDKKYGTYFCVICLVSSI